MKEYKLMISLNDFLKKVIKYLKFQSVKIIKNKYLNLYL